MMDITIQVSEVLGERLLSMPSRIPEVLARGLQELSPLPNRVYQHVLGFLSQSPSAAEIVRFEPTSEMQQRTSDLLIRQREQGLSRAESEELDEYLHIDHFITMIKARALPFLPPAPE